MKSILSLYFLIAFVIGTDTFLVSPLLPTLRQQFHISVEASGWMVGAYALGYALFALIAGPVSDGLNRKKIMLFGILGFAVSTFLCGLAWNFWSMFAFRALAGIFAAFTSPQVWATIPILVPAPKVTKSMGIVSAGFAVSQTVGVPIGSYLAEHSWKMPFFIIGGIAFALFALILWIVPQFKPATAGKQPSILDRYAELLGANGAKGSYLAYFAILTGALAVFTFIGNWLTDKFGMNVSEIGHVFIFMGLGNLIGSFVGGHAAARLGGRTVLLGGIGIMAVLYLLLNLAASPLLVHLCFFVLYLVFGTIFPLMMALLQTLSTTARGTIAALSNGVLYAATTAGAYIAGILYAQLNGFFGVTVFAALCCALSIGLWAKSQPKT
ncbi:MFS transporter [Paenibacillus sp. 7124]|uniref:MFS transporter n=1 Tax=Paenibacillus apii TaxID=1850370 RepID=A0A6M1PVC9_9BACL|nr:MFS transporter [Paenibacillus apii]NGM84141.1 MFS transporter [Paenibacillus apii]NJJ38678.1 MFS transporter [Paenibacillus apii]